MLNKEKLEQISEMMEELRNLLSSVNGTKALSETFSICYVALVENEESKAAVEAVANTLKPQAKKYGLDIEIVAATEQDLAEAQDKLAEHASANAIFKS